MQDGVHMLTMSSLWQYHKSYNSSKVFVMGKQKPQHDDYYS